MVVVSSVEADRESRNFYLSVKGETEEALGRVGFRRLDVLRPSLLRGERAERHRWKRAGRWSRRSSMCWCCTVRGAGFGPSADAMWRGRFSASCGNRPRGAMFMSTMR
ncbi:hypothetical protein ACFSLT_15865 [Novosphingobium resinovorum]